MLCGYDVRTFKQCINVLRYAANFSLRRVDLQGEPIDLYLEPSRMPRPVDMHREQTRRIAWILEQAGRLPKTCSSRNSDFLAGDLFKAWSRFFSECLEYCERYFYPHFSEFSDREIFGGLFSIREAFRSPSNGGQLELGLTLASGLGNLAEQDGPTRADASARFILN